MSLQAAVVVLAEMLASDAITEDEFDAAVERIAAEADGPDDAPSGEKAWSFADGMAKAGPPGPPPRPGLDWKDETHRWIRPDGEGGGEAGSAEPAPAATAKPPAKGAGDSPSITKLMGRLTEPGRELNSGQVEQIAMDEWFNDSAARKEFSDHRAFGAAARAAWESRFAPAAAGVDPEQDARNELAKWSKSNERKKLVTMGESAKAKAKDREIRAVILTHLKERIGDAVTKAEAMGPHRGRNEAVAHLESLEKGDYVVGPNSRIGVVVKSSIEDQGNSFRGARKVGEENSVRWIDSGEAVGIHGLRRLTDKELLSTRAIGVNAADARQPAAQIASPRLPGA